MTIKEAIEVLQIECGCAELDESNGPVSESTYRFIDAAHKAIEIMKCVSEPEPIQQPELPALKNNDQRKEWLRNYRDWGLWYVDEHIGARYYKYDFDNGARLIAEEYEGELPHRGPYTSSYLHLVAGPEPPKHAQQGIGKWNRNEKYNRFPSNETELIEFLKELQKKG